MADNIPPLNIGIVSTRLAGTDGVSLEVQKWVAALEHLGHRCFFFAGESDWPPDRTMLVEQAHFNHPAVQAISCDLFDDYKRSTTTSGEVQRLRYLLKQELEVFLKRFNIHLLIAENALAIPMNIPLGLALTELVAETRIPTIGHHHDFSWERSRFSVNSAQDYLQAAFPPRLPSVKHVVINSFAASQLALRTGLNASLIPNVMDFDNPPAENPGRTESLRESLGISPDTRVLLQPTRIVPRKRIELAIELIRRMNCDPCILLISHKSGDEGSDYERYLRDYASLLDVRVQFGSEIINHRKGFLPDGREIFSLADAYQLADLVTYPSTIEGFGNAFLEAVYYRRPIVMSEYEIFRTDIHPKGFHVIGFNQFISDDTVQQSLEILEDREKAAAMAEHNYIVGQRHYSFTSLRSQLSVLLNQAVSPG